MNAQEILEQEITQELTRHGLWVAGRKCSCGCWNYKAERGQARASYAAMIVAHHRHTAIIIAKRLLDCGGLPPKKFLARPELAQTGEDSPTHDGPDAVAPIVRAGESFATLSCGEKMERQAEERTENRQSGELAHSELSGHGSSEFFQECT